MGQKGCRVETVQHGRGDGKTNGRKRPGERVLQSLNGQDFTTDWIREEQGKVRRISEGCISGRNQ